MAIKSFITAPWLQANVPEFRVQVLAGIKNVSFAKNPAESPSSVSNECQFLRTSRFKVAHALNAQSTPFPKFW